MEGQICLSGRERAEADRSGETSRNTNIVNKVVESWDTQTKSIPKNPTNLRFPKMETSGILPITPSDTDKKYKGEYYEKENFVIIDRIRNGLRNPSSTIYYC